LVDEITGILTVGEAVGIPVFHPIVGCGVGLAFGRGVGNDGCGVGVDDKIGGSVNNVGAGVGTGVGTDVKRLGLEVGITGALVGFRVG